MEQTSLKYVKALVGFTIVIAVAAFSIKGHMKRITEAKKTVEVMQTLDSKQQQEVLNALNGENLSNNSETKQVQVAEEPQEVVSEEQEAAQFPVVNEDDASIDEQRGLKFLNEGDIESAIASFEKAIQNGNEKTKISSSKYLAQCYEQKGDIAGMINTYNNVAGLIHNPYEKREVNDKLAECFIKTGNKEQALTYYEENYRISHLAPDLLNVCEILMEMNDKSRMQGYLDEHLARVPSDKENFQRYIDWLGNN